MAPAFQKARGLPTGTWWPKNSGIRGAKENGIQLALDQTMSVYQCAIDSSAGGR